MPNILLKIVYSAIFNLFKEFLQCQNCLIPLFKKIYMNPPLFVKYLTIYHLFETRFCGNGVFHGTQIYETRVTSKNFKNSSTMKTRFPQNQVSKKW